MIKPQIDIDSTYRGKKLFNLNSDSYQVVDMPFISCTTVMRRESIPEKPIATLGSILSALSDTKKSPFNDQEIIIEKKEWHDNKDTRISLSLIRTGFPRIKIVFDEAENLLYISVPKIETGPEPSKELLKEPSWSVSIQENARTP